MLFSFLFSSDHDQTDHILCQERWFYYCLQSKGLEARLGAAIQQLREREEEMEGVATCLDSVTIQLCEREAELAGLRGRVRCQTFNVKRRYIFWFQVGVLRCQTIKLLMKREVDFLFQVGALEEQLAQQHQALRQQQGGDRQRTRWRSFQVFGFL